MGLYCRAIETNCFAPAENSAAAGTAPIDFNFQGNSGNVERSSRAVQRQGKRPGMSKVRTKFPLRSNWSPILSPCTAQEHRATGWREQESAAIVHLLAPQRGRQAVIVARNRDPIFPPPGGRLRATITDYDFLLSLLSLFSRQRSYTSNPMIAATSVQAILKPCTANHRISRRNVNVEWVFFAGQLKQTGGNSPNAFTFQPGYWRPGN